MLRPILMQLDLQSLEKVPFSTFTWDFAPKMLEIDLPRLRMTWSFLQDLSRSVEAASPGTQLLEITVSIFSIQLGQIRLQSPIGSKKKFFCDPIGDCNPVGSKKCWRWILATGPLEKRETPLDRSWRKLRLILRRGRSISNIFGAKTHANVLKGTFSLDCKSNYVRTNFAHPSVCQPWAVIFPDRFLPEEGVVRVGVAGHSENRSGLAFRATLLY